MSTIDFIKKNSNNFVEQELWEEVIINNKYDETIENNNEYNDFSKNTLNEGEDIYEFKLERTTKEMIYYNCIVDKLKLDVINTISIKIKIKENQDFHKLYLLTMMIQIYLKINRDNIYLAYSNIYDMCIQSYIKNKKNIIIDYDKNNNKYIIIPIVNFSHLKHGYPYKKQKINITLYNEFHTLIYNINFIEDVSIIFSGKRYNNSKDIIIKSDQYNHMDVDTNILTYIKSGNIIGGLCVLSTFIGFTLIKKFGDSCNEMSIQNIDEYLDNQVQINSVSLQHGNKEPWIYNLDYMKKIKLFGLNIYLLPLFPEYCNFNNILYHMKHTDSYFNEYIEAIKVKIVLEQDNDEYDLYINFYGKPGDF
jgi:hypothetical protein